MVSIGPTQVGGGVPAEARDTHHDIAAGGRVETEQTVTLDVVGDGSTSIGSAACLLLRLQCLNLPGLARLSRRCGDVPRGRSHLPQHLHSLQSSAGNLAHEHAPVGRFPRMAPTDLQITI
jgi:hypothetical protein